MKIRKERDELIKYIYIQYVCVYLYFIFIFLILKCLFLIAQVCRDDNLYDLSSIQIKKIHSAIVLAIGHLIVHLFT